MTGTKTGNGGFTPIIVDVADLQYCEGPSGLLVTYALGSCIAVCVYDPVTRVGGMIHYMLPLSKVSPEKALIKPAMFADTGVPKLFQGMYERGCEKRNLIIKIAGGGVFNDDKGLFNIGARNHAVLRKLFWKNDLLISAEDVGSNKSRTVRLFSGDGRVIVSSQGEEMAL